MRTIIDLPKELVESLDRLGSRRKRSRAALIREAIRDFLHCHVPPTPDSAFGIWRGRIEDGVEYQDALRNEWENR